MKAHEIRELSDAELKQRIAEGHETLATMKFQKATSQIENTAKFRNTRKDIARMNTLVRERELKASTK